MMNLRHVQELQNSRSVVQLDDGRRGKIIRVDTSFPENTTEVSVYTLDESKGPSVAKVSLERLTRIRKSS